MTATSGNLQVFLLPALEGYLTEATRKGMLVTMKQKGSAALGQMPRAVKDHPTEPTGDSTLDLTEEKLAKSEQCGYLVTCVAAMSLLEVAVTSVP